MPKKMSAKQTAWCKAYEDATTFEPLMDDFLAGDETFAQAAQKSRHWFNDWVVEAFHRLPDTPEGRNRG